MTFAPRDFNPARWAPGPHVQTLLARGLRSATGVVYTRERIDTPDGDFLDLDWGPDPGRDAPLALVMHGLEGSARRRYVRNVCKELLGRGIRPVALNFRGCSGEPNRRPRSYHSGETSDPRLVLELLRERHPDRPIGAMGFSLGGNVLLRLLGEDAAGGRDLVDAAVVMSVPYDLAAGCALLEESRMGRLYTGYFLRSLKSKVESKREVLAPLVDLDSVLAADTIRVFDDRFTAPLSGFGTAAEYYRLCSSTDLLASIRIPTLMLHAEDDPFLPPASIPRDAALANEDLTLLIHRMGGHVGFLEGTPWRPRFWGDEEVGRFLAHHLRPHLVDVDHSSF